MYIKIIASLQFGNMSEKYINIFLNEKRGHKLFQIRKYDVLVLFSSNFNVNDIQI